MDIVLSYMLWKVLNHIENDLESVFLVEFLSVSLCVCMLLFIGGAQTRKFVANTYIFRCHCLKVFRKESQFHKKNVPLTNSIGYSR